MASLNTVIVDTSISAFSYKKIYLILVWHAKKFGSLGQCATRVLHAVSCSVIMKQCSEGFSYSACMISAKFFVVLRDVIRCTERHISATSRVKNTVRRGVVLKYLSSPKRKHFVSENFLSTNIVNLKEKWHKFPWAYYCAYLILNSEVDSIVFCYSHCSWIINKYVDNHEVFCEWSKDRSFHDLCCLLIKWKLLELKSLFSLGIFRCVFSKMNSILLLYFCHRLYPPP